MDVLDVRLLGHPQFLARGVSVKLPKRSVTIPLAAYLLLHRDATIARTFLAFTLWADEPEETALSELRRYIYQINKTLPRREDGLPWIQADDDVLRWNHGGGLRLDIAEFERLSASPATYEQAASMYGGDLLEDAYDEWIVTHRERLRGLYFADLIGLIAARREERDFRRAAGFAAQLLSADPWREDVVRSLMACRYEAGDSAGALAAFGEFAKRLRADLGVDPMPETLVIRDAIVRNAPLPASLAQQRPSRSGSLGDDAAERPSRAGADALPFTGRDAEFEQLRGAWARAAHGGGGLVFVSGPAGMGKSRLVAELARSVEQEGGRVCVGATTYAERFPYEGIVEALRYSLPFVASLDIDQLRFSLIAQLVPELAAWRETDTPIPPVDPAREQARLLDAVGTCVAAMARPRPLLLILEDLHWAGADTANAIAILARRLARSPVLIVVTYRDEEVGRAHPVRAIVQELRGEQPVQTIALRPLSEGAVTEIVARLALSPEERERAARTGYLRSEGNPLFLTEALRDPAGGVDDNVDAWGGTDVLRALIASRLASLSDGAREIASLAAIVGHGFDVDLVRDVAGIEEGKVLDGLYELVDRHLVREAGARRRFDFAFTHHLIHAAVYDDIEPEVRVRRHHRIAKIIGERSPEARGFAAADLAFHRERGGEAAAAAASYVDAARHAASLYANDDSIRHASKALALAEDADIRARALLERERAYARAGRTEDQANDLDALHALSRESTDELLAWETAVRKVAFERSRGDRQRQEAAVADLERRAASSGDDRRRAEALLARADQLVLQTFHARAIQPATESLRINERLGDVGGQVRSLALLAEIATLTGDFESARDHLDSLRRRSAAQQDKTVVLRAIATATTTDLQRHRIDEAAALAAEGLALARSIGDREEEVNALQRLATARTWQRDFVGARQAFAEAAETLSAIGHMRGLSHVLANELVLALRLGLLDEGERLGARVLAIVEKTAELRPQVVTKVNLSLVRLLRGDSEGARRLAHEALDVAREIKIPLFEGAALANLGNAERAAGNFEDGLAHILEGLRLREAVLDPSDLLDDRCDLAVVHLQRGDIPRAVEVTDGLSAIADRSTDGAFWPQYCFWAAAQVRRAAGDDVRASALLAKAVVVRDGFGSSIADVATRQAFFALPLNEEIAAAAERGEWPAYAGGAAVRYTGTAKKRRQGGVRSHRRG